MSQARILALLKYHPGGLTAKDIQKLLGLGNCYAQLKKLERSKALIRLPRNRHGFRWKLK